ncbi:2-oxoacid ferredoxin oxidoreductase [Candidatus Shapirobacteria bacterium CG08_land_8_20_14_0_20_39_18]|uniref:2-oxoacid ferredoxin oxidoreductase n=1 Tax=Candidatus Shapirobacteria bacterium CG08_land_8_20_14_0_20_39_18 TaxID=1974883 RepID=A0A2M6XE77_9BACT|nr:MAG: 2-oxoacid ferredoxin oxidoreductase [Candidatus Shapirobacteria bacterium CG08_land_8_20_14_0_20_39_18]PIY64622.1 MAG: 2-oxoacid ferredoxin oxidoreductase [Candidatus Shapirobacteria bacterium CG_4_10_14_0_8_um_filter_39_15]PJE68421.1 MAG: 2-oxoacid ferredoxin oxidoreductase [Candidatus Shapirobacteria bacterium CG10_big_fil_rev_8_21_14_0_10_38_8]
MSNPEEFNRYTPTWCPGCGSWIIFASLKSALVKMGFDPSSVFLTFDIGCSSNMGDFLNGYALHGLHGRAIPTAIGMKLANHKMPVIAVMGDGGCYGEGGNHLLHACRGNHDITVLVFDNGVYGLTTGQVAPTAKKGFKSKSTPAGVIETPINPLSLTISQGATFVAQGFAGNQSQLAELIGKGIAHKGFSLINILQPCVSFNPTRSFDYYKEKTYLLPESYNAGDFRKALDEVEESVLQEKFPLGVIYETEKPVFTDGLIQLADKTLVDKSPITHLESILQDFK